MEVIATIENMQQRMLELRAAGKKIGFVPTMGYLHEGHLTLLAEAKKENDIVVLSIFVNPLQFGPNEDFDKYPRDFARDEALALPFADYLFYPTKEEMYPEMTTKMTVTARTDVLCGAKRPGHFDGVVTVLMKLFHIVMPHRAYFGLKDAQQVAVVQGLVSDYNIPVTIVPVATVREEDGLAKSSRNVYLSPTERVEAPALYASLLQAQNAIEHGETDVATIREHVRQYIETHTSGIIDYVEVYAYPQLTPLVVATGSVIIAIAVKFQKARLIDNIILEVATCSVQ